MPVNVDYTRAWDLLNSVFSSVEQAYAEGLAPEAPTDAGGMVTDACREVFASNTQAYREVLLGCIVAKLLSPEVDVRRPYVSQGDHAFNGRTLDERVINKLLKQEGIPSSAGPYLSVFRRSVQFVPSTREGLRDKAGYDALLRVLLHIEDLNSVELEQLLRYLLYEFGQLRERATVPIAQPGRISLEQYRSLLSGLLGSPSGGRFPLLLVVATLMAINDAFTLGWEIRYQGINVADSASGAGGDITVRSGDQVLLAAEVTERVIDQSRVVTTFQSKILPAGIDDYLFFIRPGAIREEARGQAQRYFAQGHEVNFLEIEGWILMVLATIGKSGRDRFNRTIRNLLASPEAPAFMRVAWNHQVERLTAS